ncbi:HigA family addiction module antitoxin [Denitrificimonas sp. JX-1]|uniref:HigA family addiction module antitoxin n=1 Tax=Denitrificimonas halotolerans TaxID=3098930 RepID=A0ABU5GTL1_9GAMM|nr:HigA family addiction module antitoxin [Denitrificimonas sp. JX-1]MDY7220316.1 HigA family addiction module antitoxin [Denitrificimonas sp. JX-1]
MLMYNPVHPSEVLKELIFDTLGISLTHAAYHLDITDEALSKMLNKQLAITPDIALRLELAFGNPTADQWLSMQNAYDLWQISQGHDWY